jgi:hypothetical protein
VGVAFIGADVGAGAVVHETADASKRKIRKKFIH